MGSLEVQVTAVCEHDFEVEQRPTSVELPMNAGGVELLSFVAVGLYSGCCAATAHSNPLQELLVAKLCNVISEVLQRTNLVLHTL